jgi:UDP-2-acetamido-2-deoxy-ribo-hexuluronate aminotransferase
MDFIDLKTQQARIKPQLDANIAKVLAHGQYIMGPEIAELEKQLAAYTGSKHCLTVANGTDALLVALMALGVKAGDEVITSPFTFIATGEMIALIGATPVFVDIDERTYNIDPAKIEAAITPKTKAIMPVSLYGQCADFDRINAIAAKHGIPVIEDGAQSFGGGYKGKKSCNLSLIGCTSFFPSKPLGCYGDGGAVFTNDDELAKVMGYVRCTGKIGVTTTRSSASTAVWILYRRQSSYRSSRSLPKRFSCARRSASATRRCFRQKESKRRLLKSTI